MKEQLAALIEAYAAARGSGNSILQQFSAEQLTGFLQKIEVTEAASEQQEPPVEGDQS